MSDHGERSRHAGRARSPVASMRSDSATMGKRSAADAMRPVCVLPAGHGGEPFVASASSTVNRNGPMRKEGRADGRGARPGLIRMDLHAHATVVTRLRFALAFLAPALLSALRRRGSRAAADSGRSAPGRRRRDGEAELRSVRAGRGKRTRHGGPRSHRGRSYGSELSATIRGKATRPQGAPTRSSRRFVSASSAPESRGSSSISLDRPASPKWRRTRWPRAPPLALGHRIEALRG